MSRVAPAATRPRSWAIGRRAPGGSPISLRALRRVFSGGDVEGELRAGLADLTGAGEITLHTSGREALRVAFRHLAERSGRREIAMPAYVCFSVPAAAVAAGLSVRLVDVDARGRLDTRHLAGLPLEKVAAVVVANLFGIAEDAREVRAIAGASGTAVVDDAAQALGARSADGPAGGRGDVGVLSFGRGKPLSALGGGALAWPDRAPDGAALPPAAPRKLSGALRALAYDLVRWPPLFGGLSRIPALGIGKTIYDPDFARGAIPGAALALARALLPEFEADARARTRVALMLAEALSSETHLAPLLAEPADAGVYPRLAVVAPTGEARESALARLQPLGASRLYPTALPEIRALRPYLAGATPVPGAERLAARLLTLPTHGPGSTSANAVVRRLRAPPTGR